MAKTPSRTRKPRKQPESLAPVLKLAPRVSSRSNSAAKAAGQIKQLADSGEVVGFATVLIMNGGKEPIINTFGITPDQHDFTVGALMRLIRKLQDRKA